MASAADKKKDKSSRSIDSDEDEEWNEDSSSDSDSGSESDLARAELGEATTDDEDDDTEASKSHLAKAPEIDEDDDVAPPPGAAAVAAAPVLVRESKTQTLTPEEAIAILKRHPMSLEEARMIRAKRNADLAAAKRAKRKAERSKGKPSRVSDSMSPYAAATVHAQHALLREIERDSAKRAKRKAEAASSKREDKKAKRKVEEKDATPVCFMCQYAPDDPSELTPDVNLTGGTRNRMCSTCYVKLSHQKRCDVCTKIVYLPSEVGLRCECIRHDEHVMRCKPCLKKDPILPLACDPNTKPVIPGFCSYCADESANQRLYDVGSPIVATAARPPSPLAAAIRVVSGAQTGVVSGAEVATLEPCRFLGMDLCRKTHPLQRMYCFSCELFQCRGCMFKCAKCKMVSCWMCAESCDHVKPPSYNLTIYSPSEQKPTAAITGPPSMAAPSGAGGALDHKHKPTPDAGKKDLKSLLVAPPIARCPMCSQVPLDQCRECDSCGTQACPRCLRFCDTPQCKNTTCVTCTAGKSKEPAQVELYCAFCLDP